MPAATAKQQQKKEYVNTTQGWIGAVRINRRGEEESVAIPRGGRVFLTAEEKELTAQAHVKAEDSPFEVRHIVYRDEFTGEVTFEADLCPLEDATEFQRSGGKLPG